MMQFQGNEKEWSNKKPLKLHEIGHFLITAHLKWKSLCIYWMHILINSKVNKPKLTIKLITWYLILYLGIEFYLFVSHSGMKDRGSTCKFRNAWSSFRNLHMDHLSFITLWETNKKNSILISILYQNCLVWVMKYPFFIAQQVVFRTAAVTDGSYVTATVSLKNGCQIFSYVHSSRKLWECKYFIPLVHTFITQWIISLIHPNEKSFHSLFDLLIEGHIKQLYQKNFLLKRLKSMENITKNSQDHPRWKYLVQYVTLYGQWACTFKYSYFSITLLLVMPVLYTWCQANAGTKGCNELLWYLSKSLAGNPHTIVLPTCAIL